MNKKIYQTLERYLSNKTSRRDFIQALDRCRCDHLGG